MGNQKYSLNEREAHIRQYKESGLNATEYCKEHSIAQGTFYGWFKMRSKDVTKTEQTPHIYPLEIREDNLSPLNQCISPTQTTVLNDTSISFPNGVKVEIVSLTPSELLMLINGYCNV